MDDNALFIDTNVLVYANIAEAPIHSQETLV
jgi:predicted nucleic acid-binding protein